MVCFSNELVTIRFLHSEYILFHFLPPRVTVTLLVSLIRPSHSFPSHALLLLLILPLAGMRRTLQCCCGGRKCGWHAKAAEPASFQRRQR